MPPKVNWDVVTWGGYRHYVQAGGPSLIDDPNSSILCAALEREFGGPIYGWPNPDGTPRTEARINRFLKNASMPLICDDFRQRFWDERQHGQLDEDAGGFLRRCW